MARNQLRRIGIIARGLGSALVDTVLPPRCLACGDLVAHADRLCGACWRRLHIIGPPFCRRCGHPLPSALGGIAGCEACCRAPTQIGRLRAALAYDDASRGLILRFKHAGRIDATALFGPLMREAGRELLAEADLILPVPLHRWRLLHRGYNQAALLAREVGRLAGVPLAPDLLRRVVATRSQQGLGRQARAGNVTAEAFALRAGSATRLAGLRLLLVDDVLTTGATLSACAEVLRAAGAKRVDMLALARVVRPESALI